MATKNVMNSKKFRFFRYDMMNELILGTREMYSKANKGYGPVYEELVAMKAQQPTFRLVEVELKKRTQKPKRTYPGMDIVFILDFLQSQKDNEGYNTLKNLMDYAEAQKLSKYPLAKKYLFDYYDSEEAPFDFAYAKESVREFRFQRALDKAKKLKFVTNDREKEEFEQKFNKDYESQFVSKKELAEKTPAQGGQNEAADLSKASSF